MWLILLDLLRLHQSAIPLTNLQSNTTIEIKGKAT